MSVGEDTIRYFRLPSSWASAVERRAAFAVVGEASVAVVVAVVVAAAVASATAAVSAAFDTNAAFENFWRQQLIRIQKCRRLLPERWSRRV